jgi:hypothetical protein
MTEAIEAAFYEGKVICAFSTREECKDFIREHCEEIDPFDVQLKTLYVSEYKPSGYFDR